MICFVLAETMGFVDKLFECLTTKNYLGNPAAKEVPKEEIKPPAVKSDVVEVRRVSENFFGNNWSQKMNRLPIFCHILKQLLK